MDNMDGNEEMACERTNRGEERLITSNDSGLSNQNNSLLIMVVLLFNVCRNPLRLPLLLLLLLVVVAHLLPLRLLNTRRGIKSQD